MPRGVILALALAALPACAEAKRLPPQDECSSAPGFGQFYRHFQNIVRQRDGKALITLIPPHDANMDFGGSNLSEFIRLWKLQTGRASPLWPELAKTLRLGCARDHGTSMAPYYFNHLPNTDPNGNPGDDVLTDGKVALRKAPNRKSPIVGQLDWDVMRRDPHRPSVKNWTAVIDGSGRRGYVPSAQLLDGLGYRAVFTQIHGRWAFTFFGDGD